MLPLKHKNLVVYKKSIELVSETYLLTEALPADERFGLISQIRRSAVSIPSNIAEGASRKSTKERRRFYEISRSSLVELDTQIEITLTLNFLEENQTEKLESLASEVFAMLSKMV